MLVPRACARGVGMRLDVESSAMWDGLGFPLGYGSSLGLGWVIGLSGVNIVQTFTSSQGVSVTFGGDTPHHPEGYIESRPPALFY